MFRPYNFVKDNYVADIVSATITYHGFYNPAGVSLSAGVVDTSVAQFMIAKETKDVSGNTTKMQWAVTANQGTNAAMYNQIWDNRATLTYR